MPKVWLGPFAARTLGSSARSEQKLKRQWQAQGQVAKRSSETLDTFKRLRHVTCT